MSTEETIWSFLKAEGLTDAGAAGLMGNLFAESGLRPDNLQNSWEKRLGYTDAAYTAAVDSGAYPNFAADGAGYGLAQWTYRTRKAALLAFARAVGKSIGDLEMQLAFLLKELAGYGLLSALKNAAAVRDASNLVLLKFEKPASADTEATQAKRAQYGQAYYDKFAKEGNTMPYRVRITIADLNIRKGPGTNSAKAGVIKPGKYTIVSEADGQGASKWGELKSGAGWVSLDYCEKI